MPSEKDKFIAGAQEATIDTLLNDPEPYKGNIVKVQGTVYYVWEGEDNYCEYMIASEDNEGSAAYIWYIILSNEERRIQEGDVITVYGISEGLYTFESVEKTSETVPQIAMYYYE
jgi:hypothetical protein